MSKNPFHELRKSMIVLDSRAKFEFIHMIKINSKL